MSTLRDVSLAQDALVPELYPALAPQCLAVAV